jgi:hypothetical protein
VFAEIRQQLSLFLLARITVDAFIEFDFRPPRSRLNENIARATDELMA